MTKRLSWLALGALLVVGSIGCAKEKPPRDSGKSWMDSLEQKNPGKEADLSGDDDEDPPQTTEKPAAKPKSPPIQLRKSSGRPDIIMGPRKEISSTFGATPGSLLKLKAAGGVATLKIPEFALNGGYNIDFKVDNRGQKKGPVVGSIVYLRLRLGETQRAKAVETGSKDYELRWPLGDKDTLNLAIGTVSTDKGGNEEGKPTWTVIAPARVESGFKEAYFNLKAIGPVMYIHATTADPSEAAP